MLDACREERVHACVSSQTTSARCSKRCFSLSVAGHANAERRVCMCMSSRGTSAECSKTCSLPQCGRSCSCRGGAVAAKAPLGVLQDIFSPQCCRSCSGREERLHACVFITHLCKVLQDVLLPQCGRSCSCRDERLHVCVSSQGSSLQCSKTCSCLSVAGHAGGCEC